MVSTTMGFTLLGDCKGNNENERVSFMVTKYSNFVGVNIYVSGDESGCHSITDLHFTPAQFEKLKMAVAKPIIAKDQE